MVKSKKKSVKKEQLRALDPRPDLHEDHILWKRVLFAAKRINMSMYGALHALRCGGCTLHRIDGNVVFNFSDEFSGEFRKYIKEKYIKPHSDKIRKIFNTL